MKQPLTLQAKGRMPINLLLDYRSNSEI